MGNNKPNIMDIPLTKNMKPDRAFASLDDYHSTGGYEGARKAINNLTSLDVQQAVERCRSARARWCRFPDRP